MAWLKKWWGYLALGMSALLVLIVGSFIVRKRLGAVRDEAALAEARREMDSLRAARIEVSTQTAQKSEEIVALDARLAESRRRIVDLHEGGHEIPDEEVDDVFASLGY